MRLAPDGELAWQRLQGQVYGAGIREAMLIDGVDQFLRRCRAQACEVVIVSHKTEFGHHDPARVNLRDAATGLDDGARVLFEDGYGISQRLLRGTRAEKLARIGALALRLIHRRSRRGAFRSGLSARRDGASCFRAGARRADALHRLPDLARDRGAHLWT